MVINEESLSDHRIITFEIIKNVITQPSTRKGELSDLLYSLFQKVIYDSSGSNDLNEKENYICNAIAKLNGTQ